MQTSSITQKGQVTIPVAVRRSLGISTGDEIAFEIEGNRVYLRAVPTTLEASFGIVKARRSASLEDMEQAIKDPQRSTQQALITLDTNVLVRALIDDPTAPKQCTAVRARLKAEPGARIPAIVQAELIWVLETSYNLRKADIVGVLEHLRDNTAYSLQDETVFTDALADYSAGPAGFVDYLILAAAKGNASKLLTLDKRLARADGAELLTHS